MKIGTKIICLFIITFFVLKIDTFAQEINMRYPITDGWGGASLNAIENDNGYLLAGAYISLTTGRQHIHVLQTDFGGNVLFQKIYGDTIYSYSPGFQGSLIKVSNGGYMVYGGKQNSTTSNVDGYLVKFNNQGDTLWTRELGDSAFFQAGSQVKETPDGGFICIGQNTKNSGQNWLVKTDSLGNIEWENWHGIGVERPTAIAVCADSGYIYTGWTDLGIGGPNKVNIRITKLDKLGNEQWTKIFGQADDDNAWSTAQTQDGGYIFGGSIRTVNTDNKIKPYAIRLDAQGDTLWTRAYTPPGGGSLLNGFRTIIELPDGNFIGAGTIHYIDIPNVISQMRGLIIKIKPNGDILWYKTYTLLSGNTSGHEIKDIRPTNDGGFICGGVVYPSFPDTGTQDMWLMKIDSNGCVDTSNCVIVTTVNETSNLKPPTLSVYPNPNNGIFTLELPTSMAIGVSPQAVLTIFDYTGKYFMQQTITQTATKIDLTSYAKGIYFYRVATKEESFIGKVIVN